LAYAGAILRPSILASSFCGVNLVLHEYTRYGDNCWFISFWSIAPYVDMLIIVGSYQCREHCSLYQYADNCRFISFWSIAPYVDMLIIVGSDQCREHCSYIDMLIIVGSYQWWEHCSLYREGVACQLAFLTHSGSFNLLYALFKAYLLFVNDCTSYRIRCAGVGVG